VATGTFDILHPGHIVYLERSSAMGDELVVIVARDVNVKHKPKPVISEKQRLQMVSALRVVDKAVLGSKDDIFEPILELRPDIITLGYDQHFNEEWLSKQLSSRGLDVKVVRIDSHDLCDLCSSRRIVCRIIDLFSKD
jgi:FAD synthetase